MKQSGVEYLVEKIKPLYIGNFEMTFLNEIEQAKEIEKQQQGYSEEEVKEITKQAYGMGRSNYTIKAFNEWFEQFKNK
jgi:hypothetical protein